MGANWDAVDSNTAATEIVARARRRAAWDEADGDTAMTVRGVGATIVLLGLLSGSLALYWLELGSLSNAVPSLLSVFVVMFASVVVTRPEPFRLGTASTALVTVSAVVSVALSTIAPPENDVLGYESRHVVVSTVLLTMVILRGRIAWAWFGRVGVTAVITLSTVLIHAPFAPRLVVFLGNTAIMLAATILVIWLTRSRRLSAQD